MVVVGGVGVFFRIYAYSRVVVAVFVVDLGMAFVDNWVVGKEKGCYWLSNGIVGLVGNLAV